jgi:hypothetical protein
MQLTQISSNRAHPHCCVASKLEAVSGAKSFVSISNQEYLEQGRSDCDPRRVVIRD